MARHVLNMTTAVPISTGFLQANKPASADGWLATIFIVGTFGGSTAAIEISPDNGTTWFAAQNMSGTGITATAAANFNMTLGTGSRSNDSILIRGNLTTPGTGAAVQVIVFTNAG